MNKWNIDNPSPSAPKSSIVPDKSYTDKDIIDRLRCVEEHLENVIVLDSRHGACFPWERKVTGRPNIKMVIAPQQIIGDQWCWFFADSAYSAWELNEIENIAKHVGLENPKSITTSWQIPKQQDEISCGVYVLAWALHFMTRAQIPLPWASPDDLRKKYEDFIEGIKKGKDLNAYYPTTGNTENENHVGETCELTIPKVEPESDVKYVDLTSANSGIASSSLIEEDKRVNNTVPRISRC
ncbi:hypothetical protein HK096_003316 [Nowakowskiella sp. JEL0078]|nr:hypothetical protein HK096_003316 [Nowakowskiella sp. JEL0078]